MVLLSILMSHNLYCRRVILEQQLASLGISGEEQNNLLKELERKETEYIRLRRHKISVDDFELLTIIGQGAFGLVHMFCFKFFLRLNIRVLENSKRASKVQLRKFY